MDNKEEKMNFPPQVAPPPPQKSNLSKPQIDSIFNSIVHEIDSISNITSDEIFHFQKYVENYLTDCLNEKKITSIQNDTIIFFYRKLKSNEILLTKIGNSKGKINNQEIIQPIHNCLINIKHEDWTNNEINEDYQIKSYRSYITVENGNIKRQ